MMFWDYMDKNNSTFKNIFKCIFTGFFGGNIRMLLAAKKENFVRCTHACTFLSSVSNWKTLGRIRKKGLYCINWSLLGVGFRFPADSYQFNTGLRKRNYSMATSHLPKENSLLYCSCILVFSQKVYYYCVLCSIMYDYCPNKIWPPNSDKKTFVIVAINLS